jgi:hypothetical protein
MHSVVVRRVIKVVAIAALVMAGCTAGTPTTPDPSRTPATSRTATPDGPAGASTWPSVTPGVSETPPSEAPASEVPADALLAVALTDVRSGETFTLGDLAAAEGPVLVEPMAVWCSNCRAQQHEVKRAHEGDAPFTSVSLDVDLSESPEDLAAYADREGFDWRFAMADAALYRLLQERFGTGATNPPLTPLIVIGSDGTVRPLEFGRGVRNVDQLIAEVEGG